MAYGTWVSRLVCGLALTAAAGLAAVGCTSAPPAGSGGGAGNRAPGGGAPGDGASGDGAVTAAEAAAAYRDVLAAFGPSAGRQAQAAALAHSTGVVRVALGTSRQTTTYHLAHLAASSAGYGRPVFYLPESAGYPRWFVAAIAITDGSGVRQPTTTAGTPGGVQWLAGDGSALMLFTKASATGGWQLSSECSLAPGQALPALARDASDHVPTASLIDGALLARPDVAGPLQAAVVDDGPASPAAAVVASGPLTTGIYDNERAGLFGLRAPRGDVRQWALDGSNYPEFALRAADGGALVFYAMYLNTTVEVPAVLDNSEPVNPGPPITVPGYLLPLLPTGAISPRTRLWGQQLLSFAAVDPAAGHGKVAVIAIGGDNIYASAS